MQCGYSTRRVFLKQGSFSLGGILLGSMVRETIFAAHQHAERAAINAEKFAFLTDAEAADLEAFAAQVIPSGDSPGAKEANVVYFIDHVLTKFQAEDKPRYRQALASLKACAARLYPSTARFAALNDGQQIAVMKAFEKESSEISAKGIPSEVGVIARPFDLLREAVVAGFLSDPRHGGNRDRVGWQCIDFDGADMHEPPFGYYDAELSRRDTGGDH